MVIKNIFSHADYLTKGLDASWRRNEVIANNLANVDTPNFKASRVEFETELKRALSGTELKGKRTNAKHMKHGGIDVSEVEHQTMMDTNTVMRMDGNNVDPEVEMTEMAKNSIYYNYLSVKISEEMSRLKTVVTDTR